MEKSYSYTLDESVQILIHLTALDICIYKRMLSSTDKDKYIKDADMIRANDKLEDIIMNKIIDDIENSSYAPIYSVYLDVANRLLLKLIESATQSDFNENISSILN